MALSYSNQRGTIKRGYHHPTPELQSPEDVLPEVIEGPCPSLSGGTFCVPRPPAQRRLGFRAYPKALTAVMGFLGEGWGFGG